MTQHSSSDRDLPIAAEDGYRVRAISQENGRDEVFVRSRPSPVIVVDCYEDVIEVSPRPTRFSFEPEVIQYPVDVPSLGNPQYPYREPVVESGGSVSIYREDETTDTVVVEYAGCRLPVASFDFAGRENSVLLRCPGGPNSSPRLAEIEL